MGTSTTNRPGGEDRRGICRNPANTLEQFTRPHFAHVFPQNIPNELPPRFKHTGEKSRPAFAQELSHAHRITHSSHFPQLILLTSSVAHECATLVNKVTKSNCKPSRVPTRAFVCLGRSQARNVTTNHSRDANHSSQGSRAQTTKKTLTAP